jgi:hypothetical protein
MNISFPQVDLRVVAGEPVEFLVLADGERVIVRIDWAVLVALCGVDTADVIRECLQRKRAGIERAIASHILARGASVTGIVALGRDELRDV